MEPREKLPKARFDNQLKESANRILDMYLKEAVTILEISDKVYAIGSTIAFKLGKLVEGDQGDRKKKNANGGNRWERKLKREIKELCQIIATSYTEGDNREKQPRRKSRSLMNWESWLRRIQQIITWETQVSSG